MTNYNERLDEILQGELVCISNDPDAYVAGIEDTKQAFTSLYKELVAGAKPYKQNGEMIYSTWGDGYDSGIDEFEQNLVKALEEK